MVQIEDLLFSYPRSQFALKIASAQFPSAEQMALVGPSGCGKTTLLNLLAGVLMPKRGNIRVSGEVV